MKAHGISTKTALGSGDSSKTPTPKATPAKGRAAKKRKVETDNEDDEAPATPVKKETKVKRETRTKKAIKVKQEEVKEESDQDSDADDVIEGSFCLKDIPQAPAVSLKNGDDGGGGHDSDDSDVCFVGSSSTTDQRPSHRRSMPPTLPPPPIHFDSTGGTYPQPVSHVQIVKHEANPPFQSQMRPTPVMTRPTMTATSRSFRRTTSDHPQPSAASPMTWIPRASQQHGHFWNVVEDGGRGPYQP